MAEKLTLEDLTSKDIEELEKLPAWKCYIKDMTRARNEFLELLVGQRDWEGDITRGRIFVIDEMLSLFENLKDTLELRKEEEDV